MKIKNMDRFYRLVDLALEGNRARDEALALALQELELPSPASGDEAPSPRPAPPVTREELAKAMWDGFTSYYNSASDFEGLDAATRDRWMQSAGAALVRLGMDGEGEETPGEPEMPKRVMPGRHHPDLLYCEEISSLPNDRRALSPAEVQEAAACYNAIRWWEKHYPHDARESCLGEVLTEERQKLREGS